VTCLPADTGVPTFSGQPWLGPWGPKDAGGAAQQRRCPVRYKPPPPLTTLQSRCAQVHSWPGGGSPLVKPSQARGRQLCASYPPEQPAGAIVKGYSPWVQLNATGQRPPCSLHHTGLKPASQPLGDPPPTAEQPMGSLPAASPQVSFHYAGRAGVFPNLVDVSRRQVRRPCGWAGMGALLAHWERRYCVVRAYRIKQLWYEARAFGPVKKGPIGARRNALSSPQQKKPFLLY
jgi:hypothetical protein